LEHEVADMNEHKGIYCGLVLNFGFPSMRDGIEHVSNPHATGYKLQDSKTPISESNKKGKAQ